MNGLNLVRLISRAVPVVLLLLGCYSQAPLTLETPPPATRIIATITDTGTVVMSNKIGAGAQEVEGIVSSADATAWNLSVVRVDHRGGTSVMWNREVVNFPRYTLTNPSVKRLDKTKTWMAGALIAAAAFVASKLFTNIGADENPGGPPPPPANRVPGRGAP